MEKEVRLYIGQDVYPVRVFTFQERLAKIDQLFSRPLSEAEVAYYHGDLLLHCNRPEEALTYLQQAISLDPAFAPAHASLGSITMRCGPISPSRPVAAEYGPTERETPEDPGKLINLIFAD